MDSIPFDSISNTETKGDHLKWIQRGFGFLMDHHEWLIAVPNCNEPIWANVSVKDPYDALVSIWEISESKEFVIAVKSSSQVAAVFSEENDYELHYDTAD